MAGTASTTTTTTNTTTKYRPITKKKKRTCQLIDFAVLSDHGVKIKESEKMNNYSDLEC